MVIAGHRRAVERPVTLAKQRGARVLPLDVSAPFHCALMAPAAERLGRVLARRPVRAPRVPVISNVEARAYTTPRRTRALLVGRSTAPVRWEECMQELRALRCPAARWRSVPASVLSGLVKRSGRTIRCAGRGRRSRQRALERAA